MLTEIDQVVSIALSLELGDLHKISDVWCFEI